ncbi:MAG: TIGR03936 family radical SAM-associated protein [Firmicutes bacterium]|nr:TIGR03936 family radical SAM-associated protein [Bacillota bacterium]MBR4024891.1 TIGR03936 family radical SAM-associated protein [Bacillota bacterium]
MPRYVARFEKGGYTKYISHLDLLRVFKRAFKVMGLDIRYSNGYNPHPKMSFAQPLSLGYSSLCEYLEFETITPHDPESLREDLAKNLPRDLAITELFQFDSEVKTLAAESDACEYRIFVPFEGTEEEFRDLFTSYMAQDRITALKKMKKTKTLEEVDIKDKIRSWKVSKEGDNAVIDCILDSGSHSNLSPELVIKSFLDFSKLPLMRWDLEVQRVQQFFTDRIQFQHIDKTL